MHLSPRRANHVFTFPYAINNQVLPVIDCVTDLGVMYDNHLSFVPHINKTVNKASQCANQIIRCFTTRDPLVLIKAFNTFVRPLLECATVVWSPSAKTCVRKIETVLKRFTKRVHGLGNQR